MAQIGINLLTPIYNNVEAEKWSPLSFVCCFRWAVFADKRRKTIFLTIAQFFHSYAAKMLSCGCKDLFVTRSS